MNKPFSKINSRYLNFLFKKNRKLTLFLMLGYFIILPFSTFLMIYNVKEAGISTNVLSMNEPFSTALIIYILLSLIIPGFLLNYLMNRSQMDTYQTLPIRKQDLFFNQFIHIIFTAFIPFFINWMFASIIGGLYGHMPNNIINHFLDSLKVLAFTPLLMSIPIFTHLHCGRLIDGMLYGVLLHGSQFLSYLALPILFNEKLVGLKYSISSFWQSLISFDISMFDFVLHNKLYFSTVLWIIAGFVLYIINQKFFIKRPVQDIGKPILSNWFFPIVSTLLIGIFYSLLLLNLMNTSNFINSIVFPFLIALIIYLILDVINNRGFNYILKATAIFTLIAIITSILTYSSVKTGLFGLTRQVPTPQQVDEIKVISYNSIQGSRKLTPIEEKNFKDNFDTKYTGVENMTITSIKETQQIDEFIQNHKKLIDIYYQYSTISQPYFYLIMQNQQFLKDYPDFTPDQNQFDTDYYIIYLKDNTIVQKRVYNINHGFYQYLFKQR